MTEKRISKLENWEISKFVGEVQWECGGRKRELANWKIGKLANLWEEFSGSVVAERRRKSD